MKVTIGETSIILACTAAGKQAIKTEKLTPRQRQFILLVEENSRLGEQAVSNLLPKLDLQELVDKGWVVCDLPQMQISRQPVAVAELASHVVKSEVLSVDDNNVLSKKSFDKKQGAKDLQSFLNTYANGSLAYSKSLNVANTDLSPKQSALKSSETDISNSTQSPILKIPEALKPEIGQVAEDIMILQSLLDD